MSQDYRWGKPRKNIKRRDPRYFLDEAAMPDMRYVDDPEHQTRVEGTTEMFEITGIPKELVSDEVQAMLVEIFKGEQLSGEIKKAGFNPIPDVSRSYGHTFEFSRITGQADEKVLQAVWSTAFAQLRKRLQTGAGLKAAAKPVQGAHGRLLPRDVDGQFLQTVEAQLAQLDWSPVASASTQVRQDAADARSARSA